MSVPTATTYQSASQNDVGLPKVGHLVSADGRDLLVIANIQQPVTKSQLAGQRKRECISHDAAKLPGSSHQNVRPRRDVGDDDLKPDARGFQNPYQAETSDKHAALIGEMHCNVSGGDEERCWADINGHQQTGSDRWYKDKEADSPGHDDLKQPIREVQLGEYFSVEVVAAQHRTEE